jgi:hypothetical protein
MLDIGRFPLSSFSGPGTAAEILNKTGGIYGAILTSGVQDYIDIVTQAIMDITIDKLVTSS